MKLKCYDANGKERWMALGQIVPAGWMVLEAGEFRVLDVDHIVNYKIDEGNPYDEGLSSKRVLILTKKKI